MKIMSNSALLGFGCNGGHKLAFSSQVANNIFKNQKFYASALRPKDSDKGGTGSGGLSFASLVGDRDGRSGRGGGG